MKIAKVSQLISTFLVAGFLFNFKQHASAADFFHQPAHQWGPVSISIRGEIKGGDFDRFKHFLLLPGNLKAYTNYVWLNSPGGDVVEAMKFATLFEKSGASVIVGPDSKCYSACFIMFSGGIDRSLYPFGELGVHRISLSNLEIDIARGKDLVLPVSNDVYGYLLMQGIPRAILDKMMETPASAMYRLDSELLKRNGWYRAISTQAIFFDTVEKACGKLPDPFPEKSVLEQPRDERTMQLMRAWTQCKIDLQTKNTRHFVASELLQLGAGKTSLLFPKGKLKEATVAFGELK